MDKNALRKILLKRRKTVENKQLKDQLIFDKLVLLLQPYQDIALYVSMDEEVDTHRLIRHLLKHGKRVYSSRFDQKDLTFYPITSFDDLQPETWGILQPKATTAVDKTTFDAMVIPLVGFDDFNNRLGFGKGYYDRYLLNYQGKKIGLAYLCQKVAQLPVDDFDVPLDIIVHE